jgi:hypothetical protein
MNESGEGATWPPAPPPAAARRQGVVVVRGCQVSGAPGVSQSRAVSRTGAWRE